MAEQELEVLISALLPLVPFLSAERCVATTAVIVKVLEEAARGQEVAAERRLALQALDARGFVGQGSKRLRLAQEEELLRLEAVDIWDRPSEAVAMVEALAAWSETAVMWEAARLLLAVQAERLPWGRALPEPLLDRWFAAYRAIPGLPAAAGPSARRAFGEVVASLLVEDGRLCAVWSGRAGERDCARAECRGGDCGGRHMGLRVACRAALSGGAAPAMRVTGQLGLCYDPAGLRRAAQPAAATRLRLVRRFLEARDNVCRLAPDRHLFMVGVWGLVEHCCAGPPISFVPARVAPLLPHSPGVEVTVGSCDLACQRGYCVWNYGAAFPAHVDCQCYVCQED